MDIRFLQEFITLAEICNYQEAAEILHVSQSSLTKHIQRLEAEVGVQLFDRTTRSVRLNEYGESFYTGSKAIVEQYHQAMHNLTEIKRRKENKITVGFSPALGQYGIIEAIADFSRLYPDYSDEIIETRATENDLLSGRCDFIFAQENAFSNPRIRRIVFKHDSLAIIFPENHPLAKEDYVTANRLRYEKFIVHRPSDGITELEREALLKRCRDAGFEPNITATVAFSTNVVRMVSKKEGCTAMFKVHAPYMPGIKAVPLSPEVPFVLCCFYLRDSKLNDAQQAFLDLIKGREMKQEGFNP